LGSFFLEYRRNLPDLSFRIMTLRCWQALGL
jgi:hypothetical protein